jgi:hypothetical protein
MWSRIFLTPGWQKTAAHYYTLPPRCTLKYVLINATSIKAKFALLVSFSSEEIVQEF